MISMHVERIVASLIGVAAGLDSLLFTTNAECQRTAAVMVIHHLRENRDQWPKSWDDLSDHFEKAARERSFKLTFTQLKRRVGVQWKTDVELLRATSRGSQWEPPFQSSGLSMGPHQLRSGMMLSRIR